MDRQLINAEVLPESYGSTEDDSNHSKIATDGNSENEDGDEDGPSISYFQLFRYSTCGEKFLIFMALISSLIAGMPNSAFAILTGDVLQVMIDYQATGEHQSSDHNMTNPGQTFKNISKTTFMSEMQQYCIALAVVGLVEFVAVMFMVWALNYTAEKQANRIRNLFMRAILKQEIGWFDLKKSGNFASDVGENLLKLQLGIGEKLGLCLFFFGSFVWSIGISLYVGWKLTLVILAVMPFQIIASGSIAIVQAKFASKELKAYGMAGTVAEQALSAFRTVVSFGGEQKEIGRYSENLVSARKSGIRRGFSTAVSTGISNFTMFVTMAVAYWYGAKLIIESRTHETMEYTPGIVLKVFVNVLSGTLLASNAAPYIEVFSVAKAAAKNIYKVITLKPSIDSSSDKGQRVPDLNGDITFEDVRFAYPSRKDINILNGLTFQIKRGETVALVGSSGCGKSTVTNLVQRFYDVDSGSIYIDGVNIKDLNVGWLRDNIGLVGQEPSLFGISIRDNIKFGKDVSDSEMIEATKASNAYNFIMNLPNTFDTLVGGKGSHMSGGQKQRIAIARALVRNPRILLLDEATSALDTESESLVQSALEKASEGRTTIIIAHRLSTVRDADRILVINDGQVLEEGTHQELLDKKGQYYQLVSLQMDTSADSENEEEVVNHRKLERQLSRRQSTLTNSLSSKRHGKLLDQTNDDDEPKELKNVVWETLKINSKEKWYIAIGIIMSIISGSCLTFYAYFFGEILQVFSLTDNDKLASRSTQIALIFLIIGAGMGIGNMIQLFMFTISGERLTVRMRFLTFSAMMRQEVGWHDDKNNSVGSLCTLLSADAASVQGATGARLGLLFQGLSTMGTALALGLYLNWELALIVSICIPILLVAVYYEGILLFHQSAVEKSSLDNGNKIAVEALENIRTVASLHREEEISTKYAECFDTSLRIAVRNSIYRAFVLAFSQAAIYFSYAGAYMFGGYLIYRDHIAYSDVFRVLEAIIAGTYVTAQMLSFTPDYQKAKVSASRLIRLIQRFSAIDYTSEAEMTMDNFKGEVSFSEVKFSYPSRPDASVLRNVSFTVKPGMTVALVGSSGCGKSTCIQLIERFYDSDFGEVLMDSICNEELNVRWLRSQISLVQQEPSLFACSIADNIAYGTSDGKATMEEIVKSAQDANIHNFISELPLGYDTRVGDKGNQLSGGQKQRIAIARALIRKPKLLLLDEATSALDSESEKVVEEALDKARHGRSCIIIAHRLSTVQNADLIIAMKNGKIVEVGTHLELLKMHGFYHLLYTKQSRSMINN